MDCNKIVYDLINSLNVEHNIMFALTCINRLEHLLPLFINSETYIKYLNKIISKNNIVNKLTEIKTKTSFNQMETNEINKSIKLLDKLLLDDDIESGIEKQIFFNYILIIIHILEYINENKKEYIELCSDNVVGIINQVKSNEYYTQNENCTDEELDKYVDLMIEKEIGIEIEIIKIIKNGNNQMLDNYIINNKIEYEI
jgi:hypothetical protein